MISWMRGRVLNIDGNSITINTGNIGYNVFLGENRLSKMEIGLNQEVELVIYTHVREDEIRLFGFDTFFARSVFLILLGVNGVGPKAALNIIDKLDPKQVIIAIQTGDFSLFQQVSGIGKKTAQRIVLDLQGKIDSKMMDQVDLSNIKKNDADFTRNEKQTRIVEDAKSALSNLGFSEKEADRAVRKHLGKQATLDEVIRKALIDLRQ